MNLPGFCAEGSLYPAGGGHRAAGAHDRLDGAVHPAQINRSARGTRFRTVKPKRLACAPLTICQPDPLQPFCEICTQVDESCRPTTYQECMGVKIPKKIPVKIPDPVRRWVI